ncbi:MAG: hypothetical protein ACOYY2_11555 [Actinomycetota bacterium]
MTGDLETLSTEELRVRAFTLARQRRDVGFFWELVRHLPASAVLAAEDGSPGEVAGSLEKAWEAVRELFDSRDLGEYEPLFRARFLDYLRAGG